jgi:hypothetical protein
MKGDLPLLLESDSEEVKALLRSADLDEPPDGAMRRVLARAGVGVGVAALMTTATTAGVASQGGASAGVGGSIVAGSSAVTTTGAIPAAAAKVAPLALAKWLSVVAVVGTGAVVAGRAVKPVTSTVESAAAKESLSHAGPARERKTAEPSFVPARERDPGGPSDPIIVAPSTTPGPRPAKPSLSAGSADISDEIAAIETARRAFDGGSAREGLAVIDRYLLDHPRGALVPEATVLRIEGLLLSGDSARARALGEAFLRSHPKSPHVQRVRSLIGPQP